MPSSASSAVADALSRFRTGETVVTPPAAPTVTAPPVTPTAPVGYPRPNGETYFGRYVGAGQNDVELLRAARGATVRDNIYVLLYGEPGTGKGHPLDTPILTPTGWTSIGDLSVGDEVIGSDGTPTMVYGTFDRGVLPTYRVTLSDGSWVDVDGTHLWRVRTPKGQWVTLSTDDIRSRWDESYDKRNLSIPTMGTYDPAERDLPLPPYMLGALIADGSLGKKQSPVVWTKNDENVAKAMRASAAEAGFVMRELPHGNARRYAFSHPGDHPGHSVLNRALAALDLRVKSGSKHIPQAYLTASLAQRRELLAGLMDGDGTTRPVRGQPVYSTTSAALAEDVRTLAWSLGDTATIWSDRWKSTFKVGLLTERNPFYASKYRDTYKTPRTTRERRIVSITRVEDQEIRCIAVTADDHLYVTKDFIVTHNTASAEAAFPDLVTFAGDGDTTVDDLLGGWVQNPDGTYEYVDGPLVIAAEQGRPLLIDEVALIDPKVMAAPYSAMDGRAVIHVKSNPARGTVPVKDGFTVIGACNPNAPGARMSEALMSRFTLHVEATTDYDLAKTMGVPAKIVTVAKNLASKQASGEVGWAPQMRELLAFKRNAERFSLDLAVANLVGIAPEDDRAIVADVVSRAFGSAVAPLRQGAAAT